MEDEGIESKTKTKQTSEPIVERRKGLKFKVLPDSDKTNDNIDAVTVRREIHHPRIIKK